MPGFLKREYKTGSAIWFVQRSFACIIEFRLPNPEYFMYKLISRKFKKKSAVSSLVERIEVLENPASPKKTNPNKIYRLLTVLSDHFYNQNEFLKSYGYLRKAVKIKINDSVLKNFIRLHRQLGNTSGTIASINQLTDSAKQSYEAELEKALDETRLIANLWTYSIDSGAIAKGSNIIHVLNNSWDYSISGYTIRSREIATKQKAIGLKPVVVTKLGSPGQTNGNSANTANSLQHDGIDITHIYDQADSRVNHIPLGRYFDRYAATFSDYLRTANPAVIHAASNFQNALPALQVAKSSGIASVYEVRGLWHKTHDAITDGFGGSENYNFQEQYEIHCCNIADVVITLSEHLKEYLISKGIKKSKIDIIPNGVDANYFSPEPPNEELIRKYNLRNCFVFGFIGSLTDYEGLDYLLKAFKIVRRSNKKARFLIVGDGKALEKLNNLHGELNLKDDVSFAGHVRFEEVKDYYSIINVFSYPRVNKEVCHLVPPLKPFEAMAMAKTVLVSNVGALREMVIDNETGIVFEAENVDSLARAMLNSMSASEIGLKSRRWVAQNRDWNKLVYRYVDVYKKLGLELQ